MSEIWRGVQEWEPRGRVRWLLTTTTLLAGFFLYLSRRHGVIAHPILFAEDGQVFFLANRLHGVAALNDAYAGYLVIGPRTLALIASFLPIAWTPLVFALLASVLSVGSCGLALSERTAWLLGGWLPRTVVFAALVFLPQVAETHATLTNVMWWGGIGLLLIGIADDPLTGPGKVFEVALVVAVLLSGPIGIVFAPVIAWRWWRTRSRWTFTLGVIWAVCCAVQVFILRGQHRNVGKVPWGAEIGGVFIRRWFGPFAIGAGYVQRHLAGPGWSRSTWAATGLFAVLVVVVAVHARDRGAALVMLLVGSLHVIAGFFALGPLARLLPDRYTVGAGAALILAIAGARPSRNWVRGVHIALIVWTLVVWPRNVIVPARVGPSFKPAAACLAAHRPVCRLPAYPDPFSFDVHT